MAAGISKEKALEIIKKIQNDPKLLKKFQEKPVDAIEEASGINIPDFLEPQLEKVIKEAVEKGTDPEAILSKYLK